MHKLISFFSWHHSNVAIVAVLHFHPAFFLSLFVSCEIPTTVIVMVHELMLGNIPCSSARSFVLLPWTACKYTSHGSHCMHCPLPSFCGMKHSSSREPRRMYDHLEFSDSPFVVGNASNAAGSNPGRAHHLLHIRPTGAKSQIYTVRNPQPHDSGRPKVACRDCPLKEHARSAEPEIGVSGLILLSELFV